jgi:hypothetical protein
MAVRRQASVIGNSPVATASYALAFISLLVLFPRSSYATETNLSKQENVTVKAPPGSRYLPEEHLICTPSTWKSIATFFLANYFSHAATVKPVPGQTALTAFVSALFALLLPTSGMITGIDAIFQRAIFSRLAVEKGSRSGALCVVVRTPSWQPMDGDVVKGIRRGSMLLNIRKACENEPRPCAVENKKSAAEDTRTSPVSKAKPSGHDEPPTFGVETFLPGRVVLFWPTISEWSLVNRKVHGVCCLPQGYALAMLPKGAKIDPLVDPPVGIDHIGNLKQKYGWRSWWREHFTPLDPLQKLPFHLPTTEASPMASSSDEISYSYNLSKSLIAVFQTIYASITLFQTRGDQINRYGYAAFGLTVTPYVIMSLINLLGNILTPDYPAVHLVENDVMVEAAKRQGARFEGMVGHMNKVHSEDTTEASFKVDPSGKTFLRVSSSDARSQEAKWENVIRHQESAMLTNPPTFSVPGRPAVGDLSHRQTLRIKVFYCSLLVSSFAIAIVGTISHFQPGSSSYAQRVWTMVWLSVGILMGTIQFACVVGWELDDDAGRTNILLLLMVLLLYGVPAIGGFVAVGKMLKTYGTCNQLYDR